MLINNTPLLFFTLPPCRVSRRPLTWHTHPSPSAESSPILSKMCCRPITAGLSLRHSRRGAIDFAHPLRFIRDLFGAQGEPPMADTGAVTRAVSFPPPYRAPGLL